MKFGSVISSALRKVHFFMFDNLKWQIAAIKKLLKYILKQ